MTLILLYVLLGIVAAVMSYLINILTRRYAPDWRLGSILACIGVAVLIGAVLTASKEASLGGSGDSTASGATTDLAPSESAAPSAMSTPTSTLGSTPPTAGQTPVGDNIPQAREQFISELRIADFNKDSATGQWGTGARTINGAHYGHSIGMNAGCQNDDGGDFWLDYSLDGTWRSLRAAVGVSDQSSTQSAATYKVLDSVNGQELASGHVAAGNPDIVNVPVSGVVRLRLFINDSNAPNQACGFEEIETAVIWADAVLLK